MDSRSKTVEFAFIGKPLDDGFSPLRLSTNKDVLRRFFFYFKIKKMLEQNSGNQTATEIIELWKKVADGATPGYNCFQSMNTVKKKLNKLLGQYRLAIKTGKNPSGKAEVQHKENFQTIQDVLFDISKSDIKEKLSKDDYEFIVDQQSNRKFTFGRIDKNLQRRLLRKRSREAAELQRESRSSKELLLMKEIVSGSLEEISSSESDSNQSEISDVQFQSQLATTSKPDFVKLYVPKRIATASQVVAAADRHRISSNALNDVLAAVIRESDGDVNDFILSKASTLRGRKQVRQSEFNKIKEI